MRIQHITALAFRLLAVYIGVVAIQYGSMTVRMTTPQMRFATGRNFPSWPYYAVPTFLYVVGALVLFWYSFRIAPKAQEHEEEKLEFEQMKNVAFLVLGAFFFISTAPLLASDLLWTVKSEWFNRQPSVDRWIYDVGATLAGLGLIVANTPKKEGVPDFDEMRSQARRL